MLMTLMLKLTTMLCPSWLNMMSRQMNGVGGIVGRSGVSTEARGALTGAIKYATGFNRLLGTHRTPKLYLTGLLGRGVTI